MIIPNFLLRTLSDDSTPVRGNADSSSSLDGRLSQYNQMFSRDRSSITQRLVEAEALGAQLLRRSAFFRLLLVVSLLVVLVYFLLPRDLIPEQTYGMIGYVDDLAVGLIMFWLVFLYIEKQRKQLLRAALDSPS